MHIGHGWESKKKIDHQKYQDVGMWTILKWIFKSKNGLVWTGAIWLRMRISGGLL
jgi:hypothetical protein